jgi:Na+-transporting methylmalonyl-CoA/oxaloacetate decarboxylase gamma subunit
MFLYRKILKESLKISWNNKYLWFFGLFAAFLGGGGDFEIIFNQSGKDLMLNVNRYRETGIFSGDVFNNIAELFKTETVAMLTIIGFSLLFLILLAFFLWLMVVSQAALVDRSAKIIKGKEEEVSILKGIESGNKHFWPVFTLNLTSKIIITLFFFIVSLPIVFLSNTNPASASIMFVVLFIILVPIALLFSFVVKYAICFIVIKKMKLVDSIQKGWALFKKNWLISVEMAFLLFFLNFAFGLGVIFLIIILSIPFLFLAFIAYKLFSIIGFLFIITIGFILLLLLVFVAGAFLSTFQISSWTNVYLKLIDNKGISKLVRVIGNLGK